MAERRNDAPHPCGNYLSFRVHAVPRFTLVSTIDWKMSFFSFSFLLIFISQLRDILIGANKINKI